MAVTKVAEDWKGRGATTNEEGVRTLTRSWWVTTDDDATGEPAVIDGVIAADPSAALYQPHPSWAFSVCRELSANVGKGPRHWEVKAKYSSAPFAASGDGSGTGANGTAPNPGQSKDTEADARPPNVKVSRKEVSKVLEKDAVSGDRIVNAGVGDPFDPLPEVFRSHHLITFTFARLPANLNWSTRSAFMDTLNAAGFVILGRTYPALSLRCTAYDVGSVWDKGASGMTFFFELTVTVEYDPDGWQPKILNTGRRKLVAGSVGEPELNPPRRVAIVDHNGQPVADPVPLSAAGVPLAPGDTPHYVEPAGYVPTSWTNLLA
jgi:hypothetical protein